ncbi:PepSY domain-containing protein [Caldicellulosiruptor sp. DIB 104C]|uniref:PepSY domain-containing protein n=1 Tax=Caldicellulosiruptor sp. DIB 104C TaxID=3019889 RepID=UPI002305553D|nr:PepSY domain-containing protein [Caldicellulosiruptor sp. DIB 104C]
MLKQVKKFVVPLLAVAFVLSFVIGYANSHSIASFTKQDSLVKNQVTQAQNQNYNSSEGKNVDNPKDNDIERADDSQNVDSPTDNDVEKADEENDESDLITKAKISKNEVENIVKSAYPGSTIQKIDIGDENGLIIYEVRITDKSGKVLNIKVDASNGKIVGVENGNSQQEEQKDEDNGHDTDNQEVENEQ